MSGPTRGMVAGQAIKTQAQTKEYDENHDRIFGTVRNKERGRFVYRDGQVVNVDEDWSDAETRAATPTEELIYGGAQATDGVAINSRKRHREYLKQNGLAMAGDFSPAYQEREAGRREREEDRKVRAQVDRDVHKIFGG